MKTQSGLVRQIAYRAVVALDVRWFIELCEDVLCEHLAQLDAHLIWNKSFVSMD